MKACGILSRPKGRFVHQPGLRLPGAILLILLLLERNLSLRCLLLIQPHRFDDGRLGQRIQPL